MDEQRCNQLSRQSVPLPLTVSNFPQEVSYDPVLELLLAFTLSDDRLCAQLEQRGGMSTFQEAHEA